jgi:drug/metabolite transporter (DMT)-like permease
MSQKMQGLLILTIAMIFLGSSFVAGKSMVAAVPISMALAARLILSAAILVPLLVQRERGLPRLGHWCCCLLCLEALLGVVVFNFLIFEAYKYASAASVGIVFGMLPIIVAVMAAVFLAERLRGAAIIAILFAAIGTAQLSQAGAPTAWAEAMATAGLLLAFGAVLCEGAFTILGKGLARLLSPLAIAALVSVVGLLMIAPFAIHEARAFHFAGVATRDWLALAWWASASGIGYFWLWFIGVARVDAHAAGVVTVALPLSTLLLSSLVLHEAITREHLIGAGCAMAAVLIVSAPPPRIPRLLVRASVIERYLSR